MRRILLTGAVLALEPALAAGPTLSGTTGLLSTPTAEVQASGEGRAGWGRQHLGPNSSDPLHSYFLSLGFLPGLELGGRVATHDSTGLNDLSFNAKYRADLPAGIGLAVGGEDIGGEAQNFRTRYAVATLPWRSLSFTAGYGFGPDVLDGAFGGIEWRPWQYVGLIGEHDTEDFNGGVKLASPTLFGGLRLGATAAYRGATSEVEYGAHLEVPLGRRERALPSPVGPRVGAPLGATGRGQGRSYKSTGKDDDAGSGTALALQQSPITHSTMAEFEGQPSQRAEPPIPPPASRSAGEPLRTALTRLGFESVRLGLRAPATQVVALENRTYNHSSADAIGLALGVIAAHSDPAIRHLELTLFAYGVPQLTVSAPAALYRAFLADPELHIVELRHALAARPVAGIENADQVAWDSDRFAALNGAELVVEPLLRTFTATEFGLIDYSLGARLRMTAPLGRGVLMHLGAQVPLAESDDFGSGGNFSSTGIEAGLDLALAQFATKLSPQWTWLWSAGRSQVFQLDLNTLALEQLWLSGEGTHQLRTKMMALHSASGTRTVALGGYTWFDPDRDYSVALTGGRFYAGDSGFRLELNRYFGDTIVGLFFKAATRDDQAGGILVTLPLTPRRDALPRAVQLKGSRRWGHGISTTLNAFDNRNPLRPLLLYEPMLDLDLRRDFYDSGRLGEAYLQDELPRMHEAYELWGKSP